jgi:diacylglycerol kinase (ATP)
MPRRLLVWNGASGKAKAINDLVHLVQDAEQLDVTETKNLSASISEAILGGCEVVVAAGGDGTVSSVVNAIMKLETTSRPKLGIVPLGTANDFAGTLAIPDVVEEAVAIIDQGHCIPIDVVRIQADGFEHYYANMAAGGNSVRVSEELTDELKAKWGAFCYIRGAINVLADMDVFHVVANCDGETIELDCWAVLVANGRTNAGRIMVAPTAQVDDGLIDVLLIRDGTVLDMVDIVSTTLLRSFLDCEQVIYRQVKELHLHSTPGMRFTLDGEVIDEEPVKFTVVRAAIQVFVEGTRRNEDRKV